MATCGNWNILRLLGKGGFGEVFLAQHKTEGNKAALKLIPRNEDEYSEESAAHEVNIMKCLNHSNVINLIEYDDKAYYIRPNGNSKPVYSLAMEVASGGELFDFIAETGYFSENVARYYFHQMCDALEHMHNNGISHRDLKPENILLDKDFNIKIADFGLASLKNQNDSFKGSGNYMAPEILLSQKYSGKCVDLFALGVILFVMVSKTPPFRKASHKDKQYILIGGNRPNKFWKHHSKNRPNGLEFFSADFRELVTLLISFNAMERPSLAEVKQTAWYNGSVPTHDEIKEEFLKRKSELEESLNQQSMDIPEEQASQRIFAGRSVHRGVGSDNEDEEEKVGEVNERVCQKYIPEFKRFTQFFSTSDPESLFHTLALFADEVASEYKFAKEEYSCAFTICKSEGEEDEEEDLVTITTNILDAGNETYCVEVVKDKGSRFAFSEIFGEMKEYFGGHLNATEPTED
ncbi:unnamed protein product [Moneuplotes crassus]|uniref:Protein kinase domain-containing protein n=2 Tax=Euplotes crassus TaxID=5936 RepID=A0AAD1UJ04_EUPCR|nr:unnamed protein product [Moneuplotes crassus]